MVREHHWEPGTIARLFLDNEDYHGLYFWYNDVIDAMPEGKEKQAAQKNRYQ